MEDTKVDIALYVCECFMRNESKAVACTICFLVKSCVGLISHSRRVLFYTSILIFFSGNCFKWFFSVIVSFGIPLVGDLSSVAITHCFLR